MFLELQEYMGNIQGTNLLVLKSQSACVSACVPQTETNADRPEDDFQYLLQPLIWLNTVTVVRRHHWHGYRLHIGSGFKSFSHYAESRAFDKT